MSSCQGHIFISFPCMCTSFDTDLVFTETVSQLIQRLLSPIGIKDVSIFNLYGSSKSFRKIPPNELCYTLFASEYEKFMILQSSFEEVDIYFENMHGFIDYDKRNPVSTLAGTSMYCFSFPRDSTFYVLFDPLTNSIISMTQPTMSNFLIIKTFNILVPGKIFNLNTLSRFNTVSSFTIEDMSRVLFTNAMHRLFRLLRDKREELFEISLLNEDQITKCIKSFKNESQIDDLTHEEQTSFLFMLLSAGSDMLISPNLQQFAINIMNVPDDSIKLEMVRVFLMYMPFSTHMILIELVQIYGGGYNNYANRSECMSIIAETFFRRNKDREVERKFISFLFLFYQSLIPLEKDASPRSKIGLYDKKLVLFQQMADKQIHTFTFEGPSDIRMEQTSPVNTDTPIKQLLDKYAMKEKGISGSNEHNSAQNCINLYKEINQKLKQNFPKEVLYPFCEYLDDLNLENNKILS